MAAARTPVSSRLQRLQNTGIYNWCLQHLLKVSQFTGLYIDFIPSTSKNAVGKSHASGPVLQRSCSSDHLSGSPGSLCHFARALECSGRFKAPYTTKYISRKTSRCKPFCARWRNVTRRGSVKKKGKNRKGAACHLKTPLEKKDTVNSNTENSPSRLTLKHTESGD